MQRQCRLGEVMCAADAANGGAEGRRSHFLVPRVAERGDGSLPGVVTRAGPQLAPTTYGMVGPDFVTFRFAHPTRCARLFRDATCMAQIAGCDRAADAVRHRGPTTSCPRALEFTSWPRYCQAQICRRRSSARHRICRTRVSAGRAACRRGQHRRGNVLRTFITIAPVSRGLLARSSSGQLRKSVPTC